MATYVLVHGAWHGGWCWQRVARMLRANGAEVHAVTLTGLGERAHLLSREIGLETHVQDVLGLIAAEGLGNVMLVAHSYGGIVATAVADRAARAVARVIYLDAVVPRDGECLYDRAPVQIREFFEGQAKAGGEGWIVPAAAVTPQFLGLTRQEDIDWVMPRLTGHPIRTLREPVRLAASRPPVRRTYINCISDKPFGQPRTMQAEGIDDYHELQTGHDAMVTMAERVAELCQRAARNEKGGKSP
jgi:pimeloyl-ACP methyl ester carboxylesterase